MSGLTRYPAYPVYKDSGVEWLGEIPTHWEVKRLKFAAPISSAKLNEKPDNLPYVGLENIESKTGRLLLDAPLENVESAVGVFEEGDILFGKLRPYLAKVICAEFRGVCTTELLALQPSQALNSKFLFYRLLSEDFIELINSMTYGTKMPRASGEQVGNVPISLPSPPEQYAIAHFLDRETVKLDSLIAKKRRLIELLGEQRAALINQAVTKGLDNHNQINFDEDSGRTPWLFPLPNGWEREDLKYNSYLKGRLGWQNLRSDEYTEEGPYLVSSEHFRNDKIEWHRCNHVAPDRYFMAPEIILQRQDVLFMKDGASMGKIAYVDELPGEACLNSHLLLMRPLNNSYLPRFLYYVLKTSVFEAYMIQERAGATFFGFSQESMGNYPLSLPPISTQQKIINFLDEETTKIDALIGKTEETIKKLQEYRTALISAAVTGKIDVRGEVGSRE